MIRIRIFQTSRQPFIFLIAYIRKDTPTYEAIEKEDDPRDLMRHHVKKSNGK